MRRCENNNNCVLGDFLPLFETIVFAMSEVSVGVCEMAESKMSVRV